MDNKRYLEIANKALEYSKSNFCPPDKDLTNYDIINAFDAGAQWADEHPRWKPTDEQMNTLKYAINMVDKCCEESLQFLYNDLKKL